MKASEITTKTGHDEIGMMTEKKPYFRPVKDDTKPVLQDPILRSDPLETEEAVLRLPSLPSKPQLK